MKRELAAKLYWCYQVDDICFKLEQLRHMAPTPVTSMSASMPSQRARDDLGQT